MLPSIRWKSPMPRNTMAITIKAIPNQQGALSSLRRFHTMARIILWPILTKTHSRIVSVWRLSPSRPASIPLAKPLFRAAQGWSRSTIMPSIVPPWAAAHRPFLPTAPHLPLWTSAQALPPFQPTLSRIAHTSTAIWCFPTPCLPSVKKLFMAVPQWSANSISRMPSLQ